MAKAKIKKNDEVLVIAGKFKGTTGRVLAVNKKQDSITVDKVNVVKKHVKPTQQNPDGGITEFEAPIHISNVKLVDKSAQKAKAKAAKKETKKSEDKKDLNEAPKPEVKAEVKAAPKPVAKQPEVKKAPKTDVKGAE